MSAAGLRLTVSIARSVGLLLLLFVSFSGRIAAETETPAGDSRAVDLMATIDPPRHAVRNSWHIADGALVSDVLDNARVEVPFAPPRQYVLTAVVERVRGNDYLGICLPVAQSKVTLALHAVGGRISGLHYVDGKEADKNETTSAGAGIFPDEKPHTIVCSVSRSRVQVTFDGRTIIDWKGNPERLSLNGWAGVPNDRRFTLVANRTEYRFTKLELRSIPEQALPLPDEVTLAAASQALSNERRDEFERAVSGERKIALARKLLGEAGGPRLDAATRCALYDQVRRLAAEAGETTLAWGAIDEWADSFAVNRIALKNESAQISLRLIRHASDALKVAQAYLDLYDEARDLGQYSSIGPLEAGLAQAARKLGTPALREQMQIRAREIGELAEAYGAARLAEERLLEAPDDPAANREWGRFLCFHVHDWPRGLPFLAKGDDTRLAAAARDDLGRSSSAEALVQRADAWWALSESEKDSPRRAIEDWAFGLYQDALPALTGAKLATLEQKALRAFGKTHFFETSLNAKGVSLGGVNANVGTTGTVELWVSTFSQNGFLITKRQQENDSSLGIYLAGGRPVVYGNASNYEVKGESPQAINDGRWHHLAAVKSGQEVELYQDGRPVARITTRDQFVSRSPWKLGFFGARNDGALNARFCRVRVSKVARYGSPFIPDRLFGADKMTQFMP